jgi:hypothetical protein
MTGVSGPAAHRRRTELEIQGVSGGMGRRERVAAVRGVAA